MDTMTRLFGFLALLMVTSVAAADSPEELALQAELDRARAEVADQVQLMAYELVDELVYGWTQSPVFDTQTPVVLAELTVPVGLGTGLSTLAENHTGMVIADNPTTNVQLVHCPQCTAVTVHSGPEGTVVSRGYDNPEVLAQMAGASRRHALFIDIEAEGTDLVLRARITRLTPDLPIVWSRSLSTSANTPAMLRSSDALTSSQDARDEYMNTLKGRGPLLVPLRFSVRTYAQPFSDTGAPPPPFLWLESGVEIGTTNARAWTSSFTVGAAFIPGAYQGLMAQARISRLLTGRSRSLTKPDLYAFIGTSVMRIWGPTAIAFQNDVVDTDIIVGALVGDGPRYTLGTAHLGLDLRLGNRIGISAFAETLPARRRSQNIGSYIDILGVSFQTFGSEVTFWF